MGTQNNVQRTGTSSNVKQAKRADRSKKQTKSNSKSNRSESLPKNNRARQYDIRAKARFNAGEASWTSEMAWAVVRYYPRTKKISIIDVYKQKCKSKDLWVKPYFSAKGMQQLAATARYRYENGKFPPGSGGSLRSHEEELCGKCKALGYSCKRKTVSYN